MKIVGVLVLFRFLVTITADCSYHCEAYDCPCECIKNQVNCWNRNLTMIFKFPSHSHFHSADFGSNHIRSLTKHFFHQNSWKKLETLKLSANRIVDIEEHCFAGLHQLMSLFLNSNEIKLLHEDTFRGITKLKRLYLNDNKIQSIPKEIFKPLRKTLHLLYLQDNQIRFIDKQTFEDFFHLRTLDISGNKLTTIDASFLHSSKNIAYLFMGNNLWNCDGPSICSAYGKILKQQKKEHQVQSNLQDKMICVTPQKFANKSMDMLIENYDCSQNKTRFSKVTIIVSDGGRSHTCKLLPTAFCFFISLLFSNLICAW